MSEALRNPETSSGIADVERGKRNISILNLVSGGTVTLLAEGEENQLHISITDDGVGLPEGWSLETSSGTGLSITQERIRGLHQLRPISHGEFELLLKDGHRSRISRTYRIEVEKRLGQSL